jgi:hypothetical protein
MMGIWSRRSGGEKKGSGPPFHPKIVEPGMEFRAATFAKTCVGDAVLRLSKLCRIEKWRPDLHEVIDTWLIPIMCRSWAAFLNTLKICN